MFMHSIGGWWMLGGLLMFLFWCGIIALIIGGIARLNRRNACMYHHSMERDNSVEIARERYAKGEITKEQFEQIKKDLT